MGHSARPGYQLSCESDRPATFSPVQPFLSANGISPSFPSRPRGGRVRSLVFFVVAALLAFVLAPGTAAGQSAVAPVTQAVGAAAQTAQAATAPASSAPAAAAPATPAPAEAPAAPAPASAPAPPAAPAAAAKAATTAPQPAPAPVKPAT